MILLDTDHLSVLKYTASPRCQALTARMEGCGDPQIGSTIISVEEQWRGWFAVIARSKAVRRQVKAYAELVALHAFLGRWTILPFDDLAADRFEELRRKRHAHRRHGPQDCVHRARSWCARTVGQPAGLPKGPRTAGRELDGLRTGQSRTGTEDGHSTRVASVT